MAEEYVGSRNAIDMLRIVLQECKRMDAVPYLDTLAVAAERIDPPQYEKARYCWGLESARKDVKRKKARKTGKAHRQRHYRFPWMKWTPRKIGGARRGSGRGGQVAHG